MKILLAVTAIIEASAGAVLGGFPSAAVALLLGFGLDTPAAVILGHLTGVALLALGVACWLARNDTQSRAASGLVTGGFAYDTSAVSDANRSVSLPLAKAYRFGLGAFWKVSQAIDLGAAYEIAWSGNMPVNQGAGTYRGQVSGSFNNACFNFFSVNLNWRF